MVDGSSIFQKKCTHIVPHSLIVPSVFALVQLCKFMFENRLHDLSRKNFCHTRYRNTRPSWTSQFLTVSQKGCLKRKTHPQEERKHLFICSKTRDGENQMFSFFFLSLSLWYVLSCPHLGLPFPPSSLSVRFLGVGSFRLWFSVRYALGFQYCFVAVCMVLLVLFFVFECFEDV